MALPAVLFMLLQLTACSMLQQPQVSENTDQSQSLTPQLTEAYNQGLKLLQSKDYDSALTAWQKLAADYPQYPGVWTNLAVVQYQLGKYSDSLASSDRASQLDSSYCPALKVKALTARQLGDFKLAEQSYLASLQCAGGDADVHYNLGILYDLYLHDMTKALIHYRKAAELNSEEDEVLTMWITDLERRNKEQVSEEQVAGDGA